MNTRTAKSRATFAILACTVLALGSSSKAMVGDPTAATSRGLLAGESALQETAHESWTWRVAPYLWATQIDGSLRAGNLEADFGADFGDILDNLDSCALVTVEARKDRFGVLADLIYLGLDIDGEGPGGADADAEVNTKIMQLAGLYRVSPTSPFELGGGLRYLDMETDLEVGALSSDSDRSALDGFAAGRARWPIAEHWSFALYADVGTGDSDLTWQTSALLGVEFDGWGLGFGYRMLDYDFEEASDELDLTFEGPIFGAEFWF